MFWTKLKAIAIASGVFLAIGVGTGVTLGFVAQTDDKKVESKSGRERGSQGASSRPPRSNTGHW